MHVGSVERIEVYKDLPPEPQAGQAEDIEESWPAHGSIFFHDVQLRYATNLALALKGINFEVRPGEKIGIVGRTGSGKSSCISALFRVSPALSGGKIVIDGVDIAHVRLEKLRKSLAIIPQDAILFVRFRLCL